MHRSHHVDSGFTIVELIIVVVVTSILAAITIVAYTGVRGRAYDASVQSDLRNIGNQILSSQAISTILPNDETSLQAVGLKVAKGSYGADLISGGKYNVLYCSTVTGYSPAGFAVVAGSQSGSHFSIKDGQVSAFPDALWLEGWGTICPNILGVSAGNSASGIWLYENSVWKSWLGA